MSLAVQEVQEGFPGFEEVVAKNGSAASGAGKLYLWAWLVSGKGRGPDDGEVRECVDRSDELRWHVYEISTHVAKSPYLTYLPPTTPMPSVSNVAYTYFFATRFHLSKETYISSATFASPAPTNYSNNNDSDSDTGGGGRTGTTSLPLTRHSVAEPITPPNSPGGDQKKRLDGTSLGRPSTSPGLTINTKMSPPTHPLPSHQDHDNLMSPVADLDGLEKDLYGSDSGMSRGGTPSSHRSRGAFTPSPPLDLSRVQEQLNVDTMSPKSDRGVSPMSWSSETDNDKERYARTQKAKVPRTPKNTKKVRGCEKRSDELRGRVHGISVVRRRYVLT